MDENEFDTEIARIIDKDSKIKVTDGNTVLVKLYSNIANLTENMDYNLKFHDQLEIFREIAVIYDNVPDSRNKFISIPIICRAAMDSIVYNAAALYNRIKRKNLKIDDHWDNKKTHPQEYLRQWALSLKLLDLNEISEVENVRELGNTFVHKFDERGYKIYKEFDSNPKKIKTFIIDIDNAGKKILKTKYRKQTFMDFLSKRNKEEILNCINKSSYYAGVMIGRFMSKYYK